MTYIYVKRELRKKIMTYTMSSGSLHKKSVGTTERFFKMSLGLKGLINIVKILMISAKIAALGLEIKVMTS